MGRTGRVTPVASLIPVLVSGAMVSRASLHNHDLMLQGPLQGMRIGDSVVVERRGDVIPAVTAILHDHPPENDAESEAEIFRDGFSVGTPVLDTLPHREALSSATSVDDNIYNSSSSCCSAGERQWVCPCAEQSILLRKQNSDGQGTSNLIVEILCLTIFCFACLGCHNHYCLLTCQITWSTSYLWLLHSPLTSPIASAQLFCVSATCAHQWPRALAHYASKAGVDVAGVSAQTIQALVDEGLLDGMCGFHRKCLIIDLNQEKMSCVMMWRCYDG